MKKVKIKSLPKAQTNSLDWRNILNYNYVTPPAKQNLVGDVRKVKVQPTVAESTIPASMPKAPEHWKGKTMEQIKAEDKAAREEAERQRELADRDVLTADTRSDAEKFARRAWTVISQPMETLSALNRGYDIPMGYMGMHDAYEGYGVGSPMTSVVDLAGGIYGFIGNAAYRQAEQIADNPLEYGLKNTLGLFDPKYEGEALANYLDLAAVVPVARMASPVLRNAGKSVITRTGEVKNIIRPPKLSMNDASLYDAAKSEQLLKYIYDEDFLRNSDAWDIKRWNRMHQADPALMPRSELIQRIANKLDYPADLSKLGEMHGGFGTVVPTTHDPAKLIKFGVLGDWEAKYPGIFGKLDDLGSTTTDSYIGLPHKTHVFPDLALPIAPNTGPGSLVQIMKKVPGFPLRKYAADPANLDFLKANITEESIQNTVNRLRYLQENNLGIDWQNPDNFLFDPATGEVGIVDIAAMPRTVLRPTEEGAAIRWFNSLGVDYGDVYEKAMGAVIGDASRAGMPIRPYKPQVAAVKNVMGPNYRYIDERSAYPKVWFKNPQTRQVWESALEPKQSPRMPGGLMTELMYQLNKAGMKKDGGTTLPKGKKKQSGFQILTDANGKYIFVNT